MKKVSILSIMCLFILTIGQFQATALTSKKERASSAEAKKEMRSERRELRKLESHNIVNIASKNQFYADFGDIPDVKWRSSDYFDEAMFKKDGIDYTAFYDFNGELVGTTQLKTFADVPARGQKAIKAKYSDYTIGPVIFFDDNEFNETDMLLYNLQFQDEDNYFVELTKGTTKLVVRVDTGGNLYYFKQL
jgi:hypothetical protein